MAESTLPDRRNLSRDQLAFLNENLRTSEDLKNSNAVLLQTQLSAICATAETDLRFSLNKLGKSAVSWIYGSELAKHEVEKLKLDVQKLSLFTSPPCGGYKLLQKMIQEDFPRLRTEMSLVEAVRGYVGIPLGIRVIRFLLENLMSKLCYKRITLRLEALVGDLEDVIFSIMNHRTGNVFSIGITTPISGEYQSTHERLLKAVKIMHDIEEVLVASIASRPLWSRLFKSVDSRVDKIFTALRSKVIADHRGLLTSMGWPPKLLRPNIKVGEMSSLPNLFQLVQPEKREAYSNSFLGLCVLQRLHSQREDRKLKCEAQNHTCRVVWGIDELVSLIASQTEYHFLKWTFDQPKLVFALIYRITRDYVVEIDDVLQPLVDKARLASCSATEAWVFAMVLIVAGFLIRSVFPLVANRYKVENLKQEAISIWIHLIDLMVAFDKQMLSLISSEAGRLEEVSRGISVFSVFSTRREWLKLWAKIELKDAWKTLKIELSNDNCWLDSLSTRGQPDQQLLCSWQEYKAPSVAEFAIKMAWDLIERGKHLPHIPLQVQFIRWTAGRFFWYFLEVLILRCERQELGKDELGHDALCRVCESINTARFIESKLSEWSDDVAFVEMVNVETKTDLALPDTFSDRNCFFNEEMKSLAELQTNGIMAIITDALCQFAHLSWNFIHCKSNEHSEAIHDKASKSSDPRLLVSHSFIEPLDCLRDRLIMLEDKLNPSNFLDLWRSMADGLDHFILHSILETGTQLSSKGAHQFDTDIKAAFLVFQPFCDRPEAFLPRIRYTLQLLQTDKSKAGHLSRGSHETEYLRENAIPHLRKDQVEKIMNIMRY